MSLSCQNLFGVFANQNIINEFLVGSIVSWTWKANSSYFISNCQAASICVLCMEKKESTLRNTVRTSKWNWGDRPPGRHHHEVHDAHVIPYADAGPLRSSLEKGALRHFQPMPVFTGPHCSLAREISPGLGSNTDLDLSPGLAITSWGTLGKLLNISELPLSHLLDEWKNRITLQVCRPTAW